MCKQFKAWINALFIRDRSIPVCLVSCIYITLTFHNSRIRLKIIFHRKQLPITNPTKKVPSPSNAMVNPPPLMPPYLLVNPQFSANASSIPVSATTYLTVPYNPEQHTIHSPQAIFVQCTTASKIAFNGNLDLI